ncbi:protein strawberry notch homolog 1-like [Mytilus trossulus]|uniref:protein strawberry notch homolog 1-like n=1 Tax=Mytilus trossulus TaxID=6551 RepID=UPI003005917C
MASEENNPFTDILSAALDESGITGDEFDFSAPEPTPEPVQYTDPNILISQNQYIRHEPVQDPNVFSHALKQLATTNYQVYTNQRSSPVIFSNSRGALNKTSSSPAIIRVPPTGQYVGQKQQQIKLQPSTQGGQPRIIKITRVGSNANNPSAINLANLPGSGAIRFNANSGLGLHPSIPSNLAGKKIIITNGIAKTRPSDIPSSHVVYTQPNIVRSTNSPVQFINQGVFAGGKVFPNSSNAGVSLLNKNIPHTLQSNIPTMLHSPSMPNMNSNSLSNGEMSNIIKTNITQKDISRLWSNQDLKLKSVTQNMQNIAGMHRSMSQQTLGGTSFVSNANPLDDDDVEEEVQELGHAETYANYMPTKLNLGIKHPDPVVETSSLSSVEPEDVWYKLAIPDTTIECGELSALQLEAIVYACQRHNVILPSGDRSGFLIGDGAGVGKGRTVAGVIYENYLLGRKRAIWLSVSNDLKVDAERDLRDIGAGRIEVHSLNKLKYAKISSKENGSVKKGVIFATYSSLIGESQSGGKYNTRLKQLLKWCGKDFDGCIVFDECHKAKNLCPTGSSKPTKTGQTVLELQNRLPKARIVYASATGASEPKNMAYMTRLGLWGPGTPFKEFGDFIQAVERRGVGAMELVAMEMKLRGMYIARQLSFQGVTFRIEDIPLEENFIKCYNKSVRMWVTARTRFQRAADLMDAEHRMKKTMWGQFWSAHQRFFKYLCISSKVNACVRLARDAVKSGKCVVIGLQSTGEARTLEQLEEMGGELNDFVSTAKGVFQTLVDKHFPAPDRKKTFDLFGDRFSSYKDKKETPAAAKNNKNNKRKNADTSSKKSKKAKGDSSDTSSGSDSSDSDMSDIDLGLGSASSSDNSDVDNFNPFGGSDSDDDNPWVKKKKGKSKTKSSKVNKKKKKDLDFDEEFDKALAAAGLLKKANPAAEKPSSSTSNGNHDDNNTNGNLYSMDSVEQAIALKRELMDMLEELDDLPPNTLDHLIDELGGPDNVAEMTGRKGRVVSTDEGISYESRSEMDVPLEILNLTEKQRFMDGEKDIAIISEAASSGISLQSDKRAINRKRRVHITLELPWSADRAIQQFGRTHRSNQVTAPEYAFLISELAGEQRFASTVAKRLESLGALTHGDRRATESRDLSRFNFDNKYGRTALESVMKSCMGFESPLVPFPKDFEGNFCDEVRRGLVGVGLVSVDSRITVPILDKDYNNISKFLNRILGMEVCLQNSLFKFFSNTLTAIILDAKRSGRWDMGILDLGAGEEKVSKKETKTFVGNAALNTAKTELNTVTVERGMSWTQVLNLYRKYSGEQDGFYVSANDKFWKKTAILAVYHTTNKKKEKLYDVYRPNTGRQPHPESLTGLLKRYKKVLPDNAQKWWEDQYISSAVNCSHAFWKGNCKKTALGLQCDVGLRTRTFHVLSGSVLSVWNKLENVLASAPGGINSKMQIIRLKTDAGERIVGSLIPSNCLMALCNILSQDCVQTYTEQHTQPVVETDESHLSMPSFDF